MNFDLFQLNSINVNYNDHFLYPNHIKTNSFDISLFCHSGPTRTGALVSGEWQSASFHNFAGYTILNLAFVLWLLRKIERGIVACIFNSSAMKII